MFKKRSARIRRTFGDNILDIVTTLLLIVLLIIVAYPLIYVISASFSDPKAIAAGRVLLWPVDFSTSGYEFIFYYESVWIGFKNSVFYTIAGVAATMILSICFAFPLSRPNYQGRKAITMIFIFAMFTSPGLIPNFLTRVKLLGLYGSPLSVILAGCIGMSTLTILRTAFHNVPRDLYEAAEMDGASPLYQMIRIGIPLSKATIGVQTLYSFVGCWNDYFNAMIYLPDEEMHPLSLVARMILTASEIIDQESASASQLMALAADGTGAVKYALIIVTTVPVLLMYAIVQKNFKKGLMVGSIKG